MTTQRHNTSNGDKFMARKMLTALTVFAIAAINTGCAQWNVAHQEHGAAVRSVMNSQIHDYEAAMHPNPDAVEGSDPGRLNSVLEAYREHVSRPDNIQQPLAIGSGRGR